MPVPTLPLALELNLWLWAMLKTLGRKIRS
jgi:hypothetical protein